MTKRYFIPQGNIYSPDADGEIQLAQGQYELLYTRCGDFEDISPNIFVAVNTKANLTKAIECLQTVVELLRADRALEKKIRKLKRPQRPRRWSI